MGNGRFKLTFMSLDDGHEWHKYYDSYEEVSFAYERALGSSYWQNIVGAFDPEGRGIKTLFEIRREDEEFQRKERAKADLDLAVRRQAELDADPIERFIGGAMKWFLIVMGVMFVIAMFRG